MVRLMAQIDDMTDKPCASPPPSLTSLKSCKVAEAKASWWRRQVVWSRTRPLDRWNDHEWVLYVIVVTSYIYI